LLLVLVQSANPAPKVLLAPPALLVLLALLALLVLPALLVTSPWLIWQALLVRNAITTQQLLLVKKRPGLLPFTEVVQPLIMPVAAMVVRVVTPAHLSQR
jgi:hypothetical protein